MKNFRFILLSVLITFQLFLTISIRGEVEKDSTLNTELFSLIDIVIEADTVTPEVDETLQYIVEGYYAEATVPESVTPRVLDYLASVYKEHGYRETGSWVSSSPTSAKRYVPYSGDLPEYEISDFIMPVAGHLTSGYGFRPQFNRFHRGIDFALNFGDTIKCVLPGIVTKISFEPGGYGNYVVVAHSGGVETLYGHLNRHIVSPGQKLNAGQPVGVGGSTGNSTGPHLHFETRYRGVALDPISWFNLDIPLNSALLKPSD